MQTIKHSRRSLITSAYLGRQVVLKQSFNVVMISVAACWLASIASLRRAFASAGAAVNSQRNKEALVSRLLTAKENTGKTFSEIGRETGLTNAYAAQLLYNQVREFWYPKAADRDS